MSAKQQVLLSKSLFMRYQQCPEATWHSVHRPLPGKLDEIARDAIQQGFEVEDLSSELFPDLVYIAHDSKHTMSRKTAQSMEREPHRPLTQATFISPDGCLTKVDFLKLDSASGRWDIYEAKASTKVDSRHIQDLAFQRRTVEACGVPIGRTYLLLTDGIAKLSEMNGAAGDLKLEDVTNEVSALANDLTFCSTIQKALAYLNDTARTPVGCACVGKTAAHRCDYFRVLNPDLPSYSIFDITVHSSKRAVFHAELQARGIVKIDDVPEDLLPLAGAKASQIVAHQNREVAYDLPALKKVVVDLVYPIYFLDYETAKWAVPRYPGTASYQQIPFQYSLHVLHEPLQSGVEPKLSHYEHLATSSEDPRSALAASLARDIGPTGSVIVWSKSFEQGRNRELGRDFPEYAEFMADVNDRIYDLMEVFKKGYYRDWRFKGSSSIKNVLPVVCPDLSYKGMAISNGGEAMTEWPRVVFDPAVSQVERERVFNALLEYCKLDTYAMVAIFRVLHGLAHPAR